MAGRDTLRTARLLDEMMSTWPDSADLGREILKAEQEGDRITHDIVQRLNSTFVTPIDREDIYAVDRRHEGQSQPLDDVVGDSVALLLGLGSRGRGPRRSGQVDIISSSNRAVLSVFCPPIEQFEKAEIARKEGAAPSANG